MPERRQAFRREPIEIMLTEELNISVAPVPWEVRNDIGNAIIEQHTRELNEAVKLFVDTESGLPQLQARLSNKLSDPFAILKIGLQGEYDKATSSPLYPNQITELLVAICEINDLKHLIPLVDPNSVAPDAIGGAISSILQTEAGETPNPLSGQSSSSVASEEKPSEPSLIPSSVPS